MTVANFKNLLMENEGLSFQLENGTKVPSHFHITEVGKIDKSFVDCGGTFRKEEKVSFQLWTSFDFHHRLSAEKTLKIIAMAQEKLGINDDHDIEVEFQSDTIGKYQLDHHEGKFILKNMSTACLASDACGIGETFTSLASQVKESCCTPESGCC